MEPILGLKKANCKNCYKCIRECPVKSIRFQDHQANIIPDECIYCGLCFVACPQNAKQVRCDLPAAKALLASGEPVYVSLAPSFIADFEVAGIEALAPALRELGFAGVEETAVGAQIVKTEYEKMIREKKQDVIISSCCHSVNLLIQKYYPKALGALAHTLSPMLAHAKDLKARYPGAKVVFVGPCVSKKDEWDMYGGVDCVLTFEELRDWLAEEQIQLPAACPAPEEAAKRARFFPTAGGILKTMDLAGSGYTTLVVDGVESCMEALAEIEAGHLHHCFVEMSACKGSCIAGPATRRFRRQPLACAVRVEQYAGAAPYELEQPASELLKKEMTYIGTAQTRPGEAAIRETLIRMGKTCPEDELNCGTCGYNTCREKAIAVCEGKADISMCLPYMKEKAESFSDAIISNTPNAIIVMDEDLNIQQVNRSALQLFHLEPSADLQGSPVVRLLNPVEYVKILDSASRRTNISHYLPEYDKYVEEIIWHDRDSHLIISIMKDITDREKEANEKNEMRMQAADITNKVIEKQMRVVQEIASLLGETTAETKVALTNLKDTLTK